MLDPCYIYVNSGNRRRKFLIHFFDLFLAELFHCPFAFTFVDARFLRRYNIRVFTVRAGAQEPKMVVVRAVYDGIGW